MRSHRLWRRVGLALLLTACGLGACRGIQVTSYYENGALATEAPLATTLGREIFDRGGNAFDVAVAVGFVLAVVYPEAGNIGGGGFAVVRDGRSGQIRALDFRERAPSGAFETMYLDADSAVVPERSTYGAAAAGVPGTVAGLYELWKSHGSLPWADLVRLAADLADTGFVVDAYLAESLAENAEKLAGFEETTMIFMPEGRPLQAAERLVQKDLAATLYAIASEGPDGFYQGPVAEKIEACMQARGGLITREDLAGYRAVWRTPVVFEFDSVMVYSMPPPSSGGIVLGQILKILEPFDFSRFSSESPEFMHLFCEASRLAFADRSVHLGDPDFCEIRSALLDEAYLAGRRSRIDPDHAGSSEQVQPGEPGRPGEAESPNTTHFSVCDRAGNMVAITTTLNSDFGCKLVVAGAGFVLNNEMDDFSIKPGHPNLYGLVGGEANKIEPGKRMLSSMSPTLVLRDGRPYLILGSRGGSKIITTVAQAILNYTRFDLGLNETVSHPRFHHQWLPDEIALEENRFGVGIKQALSGYGHNIRERSAYGGLQMIQIDRDGLMAAAADPRGGGSASGF
jgi:gamma-glutamyltranspeptidase/glutathione hydrolase